MEADGGEDEGEDRRRRCRATRHDDDDDAWGVAATLQAGAEARRRCGDNGQER